MSFKLKTVSISLISQDEKKGWWDCELDDGMEWVTVPRE